MPLFDMSPNVLESEAAGRKRSHDEFSGGLTKASQETEDKNNENGQVHTPKTNALDLNCDEILSSPLSPALSDLGSVTPPHVFSSPKSETKPTTEQQSTGTKITTKTDPNTSTLNPQAKRKKKTTAEKEAQEKELAERKKEREEKAAVKAAEKAKLDEEKAAKAQEREEKRKKKEEEDRVKLEKKKKKEEELQRKEEEKERKARQQKTLGNFFKLPTVTRKIDVESVAKEAQSSENTDSTTVPIKQQKSQYEKMFQPFFIRDNTRLAPIASQLSVESRETKSKRLEEYIECQQENLAPFNPLELLGLTPPPCIRGRLHEPVKHIMETAYRDTQTSGTAGGSNGDKVYREVREQLAKIPVKVIAFSQDVRPPYYGTITFKPFALGKGNMCKVARKPTSQRLPLEYGYDSEAEWQEEEGEDLDMEDDEEELDDEDDMDGFLDDDEDLGFSRRVFGNTLEPESTGICFEDEGRLGPNQSLAENRMEIMLDGHEQLSIDPFSTEYWEPEPKQKIKVSKPPKPAESSVKMPPPSAPANAFAALDGGNNAGAASSKLVKAELMNDIKQAILDNKALSKVGIIDFIFHQFRDNVSRLEVKNTLECVAEKKGTGRTKEWELKPGHEITS